MPGAAAYTRENPEGDREIEEQSVGPIRFTLNGKPVEVAVSRGRRLVDVLRQHLGLPGTKVGCERGECGACTVVMDGSAVNACLVLMSQVAGREVLTVEGLEDEGKLHPLQKAFVEAGAVQCGFCTPGLLMSAYALFLENPTPTRDEITRAISGNLCRCTGYTKVVEAIEMIAVGVDKRRSGSAGR